MCIAGPSMTGAEVRTWFCTCEGGALGVKVVDGVVALALMTAALAVLPWCSCGAPSALLPFDHRRVPLPSL